MNFYRDEIGNITDHGGGSPLDEVLITIDHLMPNLAQREREREGELGAGTTGAKPGNPPAKAM